MHLDEAFNTPRESLTWVTYNTYRALTGHLHICYPFKALCQMSERTYFIIVLLITSVGSHVLLRSPALRGKIARARNRNFLNVGYIEIVIF